MGRTKGIRMEDVIAEQERLVRALMDGTMRPSLALRRSNALAAVRKAFFEVEIAARLAELEKQAQELFGSYAERHPALPRATP